MFFGGGPKVSPSASLAKSKGSGRFYEKWLLLKNIQGKRPTAPGALRYHLLCNDAAWTAHPLTHRDLGVPRLTFLAKMHDSGAG